MPIVGVGVVFVALIVPPAMPVVTLAPAFVVVAIGVHFDDAIMTAIVIIMMVMAGAEHKNACDCGSHPTGLRDVPRV